MKVKVFALILMTTVCTIVGGIYISGSLLPVRYVMFSNEDIPNPVPLGTVDDWEQTVKSWDWVSQYKIQWTSPAMLQIQLIPRNAIASYGEDAYIDTRGDIFHARTKIDHLPTMDVQPHEIRSALSLMKELHVSKKVSRLRSHPSGSVKVEFIDGDELILPNFTLDRIWHKGFETIKMKYTQPVKCDLRHHAYFSCMRK